MPSPALKKKYGTEDVMNMYHLQKHLKDALYHYKHAQHLASLLKDEELKEDARKMLAGELAP